jgi:hypothetical protein
MFLSLKSFLYEIFQSKLSSVLFLPLPSAVLQIPRYIITLHELLAHTPHDHVERKSLQNARQQLEDLSRQMHDEVRATSSGGRAAAVSRRISK